MSGLFSFILRQRVLVAVLTVFVFATGVISFLNLNIEAYPDPVPPLVDIVTQSTGSG
jgi:cobalt-zinc-cadmium resistance protein CzcA